MSARTRPALWERLAVVIAALAVLAALALAPVETIWALTLGLALLFVPLIALRLVAVYRLVVAAKDAAPAAYPWCRSFIRAPSPRPSTMRCRSPVANMW